MSKKKKAAWQKVKTRLVHAGEESIPYLYRYLSFSLEKPKPEWHSGPEMLEDILVNCRIRASNPKYFNDPWDCKPCVHPDLLDDPDARREMAQELMLSQKNGPQGNRSDYSLFHDRAFLARNTDGFGKLITKFIPERWGIICLTVFPCSTLMWSHYSDHHRGICLEFRVRGTFFGAAVKIIYRSEYPKMLIGDGFMNQMFAVKAKEWEKEAEYRLVCPLSAETTESKESLLVMKDGYLSIGNCLHGVIMGCDISKEAEEAVRAVVKQHGPNIRLKRVVRVEHNYLLRLEDVTNADASQEPTTAKDSP
jgi:hypothetical protein